jgi:hypothetical protein
MREQALSKREQDPWWWDSVSEKKMRKTTVKANKEASQQSAWASTTENASTHSSDGQTDVTHSTQSQPMITSHFQQVHHCNLDNNRGRESPAPFGAANSELDNAESIQPEELFAPVVGLLHVTLYSKTKANFPPDHAERY